MADITNLISLAVAVINLATAILLYKASRRK